MHTLDDAGPSNMEESVRRVSPGWTCKFSFSVPKKSSFLFQFQKKQVSFSVPKKASFFFSSKKSKILFQFQRNKQFSFSVKKGKFSVSVSKRNKKESPIFQFQKTCKFPFLVSKHFHFSFSFFSSAKGTCKFPSSFPFDF